MNIESKRAQIIQFCRLIWQEISKISPVHVTVSDFGSVNMRESIFLASKFLPSNFSTLFALPERPEDTQALIKLFNDEDPVFSQQLNNLGVLLGKSDQIKRTRAPFYSLCLNLKLARLVDPKKRYVGNGSTIARGGTLTHLTFGPLGQPFCLGKTVQQGDAYRSIVNEYNEFKLRVDSIPSAPSFFEMISIFVGPAEKATLAEYQDLIANELCDGVLDNYPTEASRSHLNIKPPQLSIVKLWQ